MISLSIDSSVEIFVCSLIGLGTSFILSIWFCNSSSFCKICESKIFEEDDDVDEVESELNGVPNNSEILFKSSSVAFSLETPDKTEAKSVIDDNEFDELICNNDWAVTFEVVFAD